MIAFVTCLILFAANILFQYFAGSGSYEFAIERSYYEASAIVSYVIMLSIGGQND